MHEDQTQYLINNLRYLIKSKDIDIVTEFSKLKQKKYISSQELFIFLRSINSSLGRLESDLIFRKFNENNNLFIPSQRLECWFNINEVLINFIRFKQQLVINSIEFSNHL